MTNKQVTIVGAGLAGLIGAIDLARHGFDVTVLERAAQIGGAGAFHPSIHTTPINLEKTGQYTGVDVSPCFSPVKSFRAYFNGTRYHIDPQGLYSVERGARAQSIDSHLYALAQDAGVTFQFSHRVHDPATLPAGSIIATGLHPAMYDRLGIAKGLFYGAAPKFESKRPDELVAIFDDAIGDYYYHGTANGIGFGHLFQRKKLTQTTVDRCRAFLKENENFPEVSWLRTALAMPGWSAKGPQLFCKDKILAGTISGMIDPVMGFGIVAAIYSGKIAAMALYDPDTACRDFKFFTRNWRINYITRKLMDRALFRTKIQAFALVKAPAAIKLFFLKQSRITIPDVDVYPMMNQINQVKTTKQI